MLIDAIFIILMVMAVFKGVSRGLIVGLFSFFAILIALAAALKLSVVVAGFLQTHMHVQGRLLPVLSFIVVFAGISLLVQWGALVLKKTARLAALGWIDILGGILLYAVMYTMVYSIVLFYATRLHIISETGAADSKTYGFVYALGPWVIDTIGKAIPWFSGMFNQLTHFFEGVSQRAK